MGLDLVSLKDNLPSPIHSLEYVAFRKSLTLVVKSTWAPSSMNHICECGVEKTGFSKTGNTYFRKTRYCSLVKRSGN
ncbi:hypothetical protein NPIL_207861, partial [Nephila pilipes]